MTKKSVAVLADESYHLLPNVDDDNYSNLYAEHFADLWSDSNRHEQRVTGGLPGLSLDDWLAQGNHLATVQSNSQTFGTMDPADLQFRQLRVEEVVIINGAVDAYAERYELSVAEAKQELTQQALLMVDRAWSEQDHIEENPRARELLENLSALEDPLSDWSRGKEIAVFTADEADYNDPYLYANHLAALETPLGLGSGFVSRPDNIEANWVSLYGMENTTLPDSPGTLESLADSVADTGQELGQLWDTGNEQGWGTLALATGEALYDGVAQSLNDCWANPQGCLIPDIGHYGSLPEKQRVDRMLHDEAALLDTTGAALWGDLLLSLELAGPVKAGKAMVGATLDGAQLAAARQVDLNTDWNPNPDLDANLNLFTGDLDSFASYNDFGLSEPSLHFDLFESDVIGGYDYDVWAGSLVPNKVDDVARTVTRDQSWFDNVALNATRNPDSNRLVLGHFAREGTSYQKVAAHYEASYFKVDDWNSVTKGLSNDEIWRINETFLDQKVMQGKQILFSHNPLEARPNSFFEREVNYLQDLGYKFNQKNQWTWEAVYEPK